MHVSVCTRVHALVVKVPVEDGRELCIHWSKSDRQGVAPRVWEVSVSSDEHQGLSLRPTFQVCSVGCLARPGLLGSMESGPQCGGKLAHCLCRRCGAEPFEERGEAGR